ncbi:MAG: type II toxin-antitoxin system VapC family toxin [Candidatus Sulfotelmatobacter sp.]
MEVLLDTHVLVWWLEDKGRISGRAAKIIASPENRILISAAVGWELAIKVSIGKMQPRSILDGLDQVLKKESFSEVPIALETAVRAGLLPRHHRDPFDRVLVAQAQSLAVPILSADAVLDMYDIRRLW